VVPFNSFSEFNKTEGGDIWFALDESRPVCTENLIRVDDVMESPKLAE
jgi:hypothetical protein